MPELGSEHLMPAAFETAHALYVLDDVRAALGLSASDGFDGDISLSESHVSEHQRRLVDILEAGEAGRWRRARSPASEAEASIVRLVDRAPHFASLAETLVVNVKAARTIGLPMFLHPVLLRGAPGIGKTWFLSRLSRLLGLPFRTYSMSISTLGDGLQGSHPCWRNAAPGLVAKTLLRETAANPIIFIDEFDKVSPGSWNVDPYRPFYTLLDPAGSRDFVDEYLGFAMDASRVLWVMAANEIDVVPAPILDRITVIDVPEPTREQRMAVIQSIFKEANSERRSFFDPAIPATVLHRLLSLNPRSVRIAVEVAMAHAAADGRRSLRETDVRPREAPAKWRAGFC